MNVSIGSTIEKPRLTSPFIKVTLQQVFLGVILFLCSSTATGWFRPVVCLSRIHLTLNQIFVNVDVTVGINNHDI